MNSPTDRSQITLTTKRGRSVQIRHTTPDDSPLLVDLYHRLSPETRRLRFFTALPDLPDAVLLRHARAMTNFEPELQAMLIALVVEEGETRAVGVVHVARERNDPGTAELAIVIRDDYQREGLGAAMLDLLIQIALVRGIKRLRAVSMAANVGIQQLIRRLGHPVKTHIAHGEIEQVIALA
ncbi:MAG TPA: GNAT family N-acetyltransferase [Roseiflexaceae bacterium]|nr:GNAT family N-acetyltransferase [Roseiflexaceae bacterium]HMP40942.1 GNAT family N-acetyltransferase [Roseiflexaceae bacterium]